MAVADQTQALWQEFRKTKDQELRDRLILTYAPLVKFVAGRVGASLPSHVDEQDLVSYGLLGLIGAIERFDPDREIKFETFAMARIRGAIIDELRSLDWVPRSVRTRARQIERAIAALALSLGLVALFSAREGGSAWVIALAAAALAVWLGDLARRALIRRA